MTFTELEIQLPNEQQIVRGLRYSSGNKTNILCLHGWLDNANSFRPLMPLLADSDIVAIDLPGHGYSDHLPAPYSIANNAHYALQVAQSLGWDEFHLIGHSMGGCIAPFAAVASPDHVKSLILIDATGPQTETAEKLPARMARFHREMANPGLHKSRVFDNIDQAVESRLRATKMKTESAQLIIERQLEKSDDGYRWRFDRTLRTASARYYTENQVQAILAAITCPVQCLLADEGYMVKYKHTDSRLQCIDKLHLQTLPGNHHLHMDSPEIVANEIKQFLSTLDT